MNTNITKIQIVDGEYQAFLDVNEDVALPLTLSIGDIKDIGSRSGLFSKTVKLAGTKNNNNVFNYCYDTNFENNLFNYNKLISCAIVKNGVIIKDNLYLKLKSINGKESRGEEIDDLLEYEVQLRDKLSTFFIDVTNKNVDDLRGFDVYNHPYNANEIVDSFSHTADDVYKYILPWIGSPQPFDYQLNETMPGIYAKAIFDAIHQQNNVSYEWDEMTSATTQFDKLIVAYSGDKKKLNENYISEFEVIVRNNTPQNNTSSFAPGVAFLDLPEQNVILNDEIKDNQDLFDITNYEYANPTLIYPPNSLTYQIEIDWNMQLINSAPAIARTGTGSVGGAPLLRYKPEILVRNAIGELKGINYLPFSTINQFQAGPSFLDWEYEDGFLTLPGDGSIALDIAANTSYTAGTGTYSFNLSCTNINDVDLLNLKTKIDVESNNFEWRRLDTNALTAVNLRIHISSIRVRIIPSVNNGLLPNTTINIADCLPKGVKQSNFLKSIYQKFNLYFEFDENNENKIIYKKRDKFYDDGAIKDFTFLRAKEMGKTLVFVPDVQSKKKVLTYKQDDKDEVLKSYLNETGEIYAQVQIEFENENVKGIETLEEIFSPTVSLATEFNAVMPILQPDFSHNLRILYDGGMLPCQTYRVNTIPGTGVELNEYPYFGMIDSPTNPTFSIEYGQPDYYAHEIGNLTQNNLYTNNWRRTFAQINEGKMLTAYFWLDEVTFKNLKLSDKIKVDNSLWYINKIIDYDANANRPTKIELLSVEDDLRLPRFGRIVKPVQPGTYVPLPDQPSQPAGPIRPIYEAIAGVIHKRTAGTLVIDGYIDTTKNMGVGNTISKNYNGIVIGNELTTNGVDGIQINKTKVEDGKIYYQTTGYTSSLDFSPVQDLLTFNTNLFLNSGYTFNGYTIEQLVNEVSTFISADTTQTLPEESNIVLSNPAADITLTLPSAVAGRRIIIKDVSGNAENNRITVNGGTIDGVSSYTININHFALDLISNGTSWFII